jgi:hypothetical protein
MSTLWKVYGLACISSPFIQTVTALRKKIRDPRFPLFPEPIIEIDRTIRAPFRCPLGHLDAQDLYDSLFNDHIWDSLTKIQQLNTFAEMDDSLEGDEYCRMVGLACSDPWIGKRNPQATGFRQALRKDPHQAAKDYGFYINDNIANNISKGMTDEVIDIMNNIGADWCDVTTFNVTERDVYPRIVACFPPGWVKRS